MDKEKISKYTGLTTNEVEKAKIKYGENVIQKSKKINPFIAFFKQFIDPMIILLLIGAMISLGLAIYEHISGKKDSVDLAISYVEPAIILLVVALNSMLGAYQEVKSDNEVRALEKINQTYANVMRDNVVQRIKASDLVPGDLIIFAAGDTINADCRLIEAANLYVVESSLTGENLAVHKVANWEQEDNLTLANNTHLLYSGTYITKGSAKALVIDTGINTQIGKINSLIQKEQKNATPLQLKLNKLSKLFGIGGIILLFVSLGIQILLNNLISGSWKNLDVYTHSTVTAISLAVAAIPEGLLTFTTVLLSVGVKNLTKQKALVKNLLAVETLGSTSIICTDKTGTLTENKMKVIEAFDWKSNQFLSKSKQKNIFNNLAQYISLCSDAYINYNQKTMSFDEIGDPTEIGMLKFAYDLGIQKDNLIAKNPILYTLPFDSERKMHSVLTTIDDQKYMITKGAPDVIISKSINIDKEQMIKINDQWAQNAYRVIAVACKKINTEQIQFNDENELEFIGLIAMIDPPRENVKQSVLSAKKAGIKTVMITGDHLITAKAIATNLGIYNQGDLCLTGDELSQMSDKELKNKITNISVYARVNPQDKLRIVQAWQAHEKVVAMTGDGVNDAPALKVSDIGCAMGITGTDVSKQAADVILVDDNFNTIVAAVKNGRSTFDKIKVVIMNLLVSSLVETIVMLVGLIAFFLAYKKYFGANNEFYIFGASQLLWINLVSHGLPAIALGFVDSEKDVMSRDPYDKKESLFSRGMGKELLWQSLLLSLATLISYVLGAEIAIKNGLNVGLYASSAGFITLGLACGINTVNLMSDKSIFISSLKKYWLVWAAVSFSAFTILLIGLVPQIAQYFRMGDLTKTPHLIVSSISLGLILIVAYEIKKIINLWTTKKQKK
ncbi:cation-translocating P-type ATPase [Mycoplasmopsis phocirhinis]|uniref:Cation-translocating P-type ATPase n=1 Tax=Mycoplasmopsis phocirhinis TaxID=142650 RepID=A0A4P6MNY0_9BACT|nr:cation-translocating P-type ATPase [Mycoplasmopsis phocirhinis]QBF34773.1 cation-translocating P-type ATPase [Mycoplasmopsis phocirhinis]